MIFHYLKQFFHVCVFTILSLSLVNCGSGDSSPHLFSISPSTAGVGEQLKLYTDFSCAENCQVVVDGASITAQFVGSSRSDSAGVSLEYLVTVPSFTCPAGSMRDNDCCLLDVWVSNASGKSNDQQVCITGTGQSDAGGGSCNNNGTCDSGESNANCPADCPVSLTCNNDGVCNASAGETISNCPHDCANQGVCPASPTDAECATDVCKGASQCASVACPTSPTSEQCINLATCIADTVKCPATSGALTVIPKAVSAGSAYTMVIRSDNSVWGFGNNDTNPVGIANYNSGVTAQNGFTLTASKSTLGGSKVSVVAGNGITFLLENSTDGGNVLGFGNGSDNLGRGTLSTFRCDDADHAGATGGATCKDSSVATIGTSEVKTAVNTALPSIKALSSGLSGNITAAVDKNGKLWAWGTGFVGVGDADNTTTHNFATAVKVDDPKSKDPATGAAPVFSDVKVGNVFAIALTDHGTVMWWPTGVLADAKRISGIITHNPTDAIIKPVVTDGNDVTANEAVGSVITNAKAIAAGHSFALVLLSDQTLGVVGDNDSGQFANGQVGVDNGHGGEIDAAARVTITGNPKFIAIAAGDSFAIALQDDKTIWTWGSKSNGQIGDGTATGQDAAHSATAPVHLAAPTGVAAIAANGARAYVINADGLYGWGETSGDGYVFNDANQKTDIVSPQAIKGLNTKNP